MKKKIVIGLGIIVLIFLAGGLYIVYTIETSRSKFNTLITLHQVQILRDNLQLSLNKVQTDLYLREGRFHPDDKILALDSDMLGSAMDVCFSCHHAVNVNNHLVRLQVMVNVYRDNIRGLLGPHSNVKELRLKEDNTIAMGDELVGMMNGLVSISRLHLRLRTVEMFNYMRRVEKALYVSLGAGLLIAVFFALRLGRQIIGPVRELISGAEHFSTGDLDYRIPEDMSREFSKVSASFNRMASELKENIVDAKKTEQLKIMGEVAAGLAHEIKNPLTGIKGALEVFTRELNLSPDDRAVFEEMLFQIKKLDVITKSFLEYARPPAPQFAPANINEIVNATVSFISRHNLHKNVEKVEIVRDLDESLPVISGDPVQLQQVFLNLAVNALDAMVEGGVLKFTTGQQNGAVVAEVSDTGHGLDDETMQKIFQPFFTTKTRGLGIGLSISKRIVEQHKGEIQVKTGELGTVFRITLPIARGT